ncbi:MAG: CCC motif membrane protein [Flavobacterium sp.]|nr:CCC motif membrane protein [Flavobacterium sp.]
MEKRELPNATAVLVLGIISIPTSFCYGIIGIVLGIITLVLSNRDLKRYREEPELYTGLQNLNAGRICGIIGLSIGSLFFIIFLIYFIFVGTLLFSALGAGAAAAH